MSLASFISNSMENQTTTLYIIRHGQVVGHDTPKYNGHTDVDLTPLGAAQMEAMAEDLSVVDFSAVYSSDLRRARYGGEALTRGRDIKLQVDPAFRELNFGAWEGLSFSEVQERFPGSMEERRKDPVNYRVPGGESIGDFWERVSVRTKELIDAHRGETLALVAHSGVNRVILLQALGCGPEQIWKIDQGFGCANIVDYFHDGNILVRLANGPNRVQGQ